MKNILILSVLSLSLFSNAQKTVFGVSAGYNSLIATVKVDGTSASTSASGFYAGFFADIATSEKFHVQPEVLISVTSKNGDSGNVLVVPIVGKYYFADKVNLQAGPQLDYILEDDSEGIKKLGLGLVAGMGYDISDHFVASVRYAFGLTNRLDETEFFTDPNDPFVADIDIKTTLSFFQVGIGYIF
ncbi:porin family protein [Algibacter sp. 2305UL17-15]|uniref:porin family protein n=1 Tax=Algibacter sp. 2305UL17-15 TaxID=3231268 RepID=UPI003458EB66